MNQNQDHLKDTMNEYLPLRDVVFNTLRRAIITGEFAPGERLMEISLANRLGVSRTPVREAIRKLEPPGRYRNPLCAGGICRLSRLRADYRGREREIKRGAPAVCRGRPDQ